ncbi:hypothetical protein [Qipengyuania nanhaisediminis]|uniref:hypothetical protein n=1 Tax=Qipengyuania nanhaisediminis TaxID=604088 RepID=UPI0038B27875
MVNTLLDRMIAFGERHERLIAGIGWAWLGIASLSWIPQVPIPEVPYITDRNSWVLAGAWNFGWWGFVHPALGKRRKQLEAEAEQEREEDGRGADGNDPPA